MLLGAFMVVAPTGAGATQPGPVHKVTICHRTNSVTNPYVMPTVDFSAANGTIQGGPDHTGHAGPVFDFDALDAPGFETTYPKPRSGDQWGDIIPPVPFGEGQLTTGMNWTVDGQAVLAAGCQAPTAPPESPVVIVEKTVPDVTVEDEFRFRVNGGTDTIIEDEDSEEFSVAAGQVTISEDLTNPAGYRLQGVTCSVLSSTGVETVPVTPVDGVVSFAIADGEVVTCEFTNVPTNYSIDVDKLNDANRDLAFGEPEEAAGVGAAVPFQVTIENDGDDPVTIKSVTDTWGPGAGQSVDVLTRPDLACKTGAGASVAGFGVGSVLAPGDIVVCTFTLNNYAPPADGSLTNTVEVLTDEGAKDMDTSEVSTPEGAPTFSIVVDKLNNADGQGGFTDSEVADNASATVPFQISIENDGDAPVTIESVMDTWPGGTPVNVFTAVGLDCDLDPGAADALVPDVPLAGLALDPGDVVVCTFAVANYAPAAGQSLTNTVGVITVEGAADDDTSIVTTRQQTVVIEATYSIVIEKLNDANGVGGFSDVETADSEGDDVEFQITIRNAGTGSLVLESLKDEFDGETIDLFDDRFDLRCPGLGNALSVGSVLAAGSTTVCTFEVPDYAPPAGNELENTVTVETDQVNDSDTSIVRTQEIDVLPERPVENPPPVTPGNPPVVAPPVVTPPVNTPPVPLPPQAAPSQTPRPQVKGDVVTRQLPRTGSDTSGLAAVGAGLLAIGAAMVLSSRLRFRRFD